jgi:hypothetical protein
MSLIEIVAYASGMEKCTWDCPKTPGISGALCSGALWVAPGGQFLISSNETNSLTKVVRYASVIKKSPSQTG